MSLRKDGIIVVLSSPSGAGKTTLVKRIAQEKNFKILIFPENMIPELPFGIGFTKIH